MDSNEIQAIVAKQRAYFETGATLDVKNRISNLRKLYQALIDYQQKLQRALYDDLGKSAFESDMCEIRLSLSEITYMIKHVEKYSKSRRVKTPLSQFASRSFVMPSPYGVVLVMSPWNYPVLLTMEPLCDALAAGNTVVIKGSAYSEKTTEILSELIKATFPEHLVAFVTGGRAENKALLEQKFDYIFFTGSKNVGREVMAKASFHLTPVTLELGGKSPVIVDSSANISLTAKRLVFGKFLNLGQTCVAPDYVLVEKSVKERLVEEVVSEIKRQFGEHPLDNPDYGKIISLKHFNRLSSLIDPDKVIFGGHSDEQSLRIEPTVLLNVKLSDAVMQDEIFGPILPIIAVSDIKEAVSIIKGFEHPLALYYFTSNVRDAERVMRTIGFGGGCINDVVIHLATSEMGFGGFGESGMGSYHGKAGFDTFSHYKSIVDKKRWIDLPMRYQRYKKINHKLIDLFLR